MTTTPLTALVTGANRGLGRHIARELLYRGARVYAGARNPDSVDLDGAIPIAVDLDDPATIAAAAATAGTVNVLVNNAAAYHEVDLLHGDLDEARAELNTNVFGTLQVIRAFAPIIESNGGGNILNILSALSWLSIPETGGYSASKSAAWSMTNSVRLQLYPRGIVVAALHVAFMDTDMAAGFTAAKSDPADVARQAVDGIIANTWEILADDLSVKIQGDLAGGVTVLYPQLADSA